MQLPQLTENATALKEWAVVCRALELGRQIITLRKGGIHERGGVFRPEHEEFWLYPTFEHQRREELVEEGWPLLDELASFAAESAGYLSLHLHARVVLARELATLEEALALQGTHIWDESAIRQRFAYRRPGLTLMVLRVYRVPQPHVLPELPRYAGCRSWVELERPLSTLGAKPVLDQVHFDRLFLEIARRLDVPPSD
jgi:hypothetical protein